MELDDSAPVALPAAAEWASSGFTIVDEIHGGHQSRVLRAVRDGCDLVVKLTDRRFVDDAYTSRLKLLDRVATDNPAVVGPIRHDGSITYAFESWVAAAFPYVDGRRPVVTDREDVAAMASALASLHGQLRNIDSPTLPLVAALRALPDDAVDMREHAQLLHGDFATSNVLVTEDGLRVIDFDEAGVGPIEFEIGNTLYMEMFDATMHDRLGDFERFREWFVDDYADAVSVPPRRDLIDASISIRKWALGKWLDDPATAPIGIRTASPAWRAGLRRFATST